jgi:hypothetical protein
MAPPRKRKAATAARRKSSNAPKKKAPPKLYRGSSKFGIEQALDDAIHKAPRGTFKSGDTVTLVKTQARLRHSSPWHITNYSVTISKP